MADQKFHLGRVVATPGALAALEEAGQSAEQFLILHVAGKWGEVPPEDQRSNDDAIAHEGNLDRQQRVLSAYRTAKGTKVWLITEHNRSVTTLLLPEEY